MKIRRRKGHLVITIPMFDERRRSKSGRSVLIASSLGVRKSKLKTDGCNILYVANAFYYPEANPGPASGKTEKRSNKRAVALSRLRRLRQ